MDSQAKIELLGEINGYYKVALTMNRYTEPNGIEYLYTKISSSGKVYINLTCLIWNLLRT
jgi:hypothetical protein